MGIIFDEIYSYLIVSYLASVCVIPVPGHYIQVPGIGLRSFTCK